MKKCSLILMLLTCKALYALPVGNVSEASLFRCGAWWDVDRCSPCNPCDPCFSWLDAWSFRIGYYGDFIFDRHLTVAKGLGDDEDGAGIDHTEVFTNAGYLALNFCDKVDLFALVGATNIRIRTDATAWQSEVSRASELFFVSEFSWSIGARATLWSCECFSLGIEGQYFQTKPIIDHFVRYDTGTITYFGEGDLTRYEDWQVGLGASYRFATSCPTIAMIPYGAITLSGNRFTLQNFTFTELETNFRFQNLKNKKLWGYALGMTLTLCDMVGVTVEGRWGSEKALYVNGQFRF